MFFPQDPNDFLDQYSFKDKEEIYTNGSELIQVLRVKQMLEHYLSIPVKGMTVREFKEYCCVSNIVLKDSYNGRVYTKLDSYLDKVVHGFYPRFDTMRSNDTYTPICQIQIVAWIDHDFTEEDKKSEK